jgi:hypothetical protein
MTNSKFIEDYFYPFLKENNLILCFHKNQNQYIINQTEQLPYLVENDDSDKLTSFILNFNFFNSDVKKLTWNHSKNYSNNISFLFYLLEKKLSISDIKNIFYYKTWDTILNESITNFSLKFLQFLFEQEYSSQMKNHTFSKIINHLNDIKNYQTTYLFTKNNLPYLKESQFFLLKKIYNLQKPTNIENQFIEFESSFQNTRTDFENQSLFIEKQKQYESIEINFQKLKQKFFIDINFENSEYSKILKFAVQSLKKYKSHLGFDSIIFDNNSLNPVSIPILFETSGKTMLKKEMIQNFIVKYFQNYQKLIQEEISLDGVYSISHFYKAKDIFKKNSFVSNIFNHILLENSVPPKNNLSKTLKI